MAEVAMETVGYNPILAQNDSFLAGLKPPKVTCPFLECKAKLNKSEVLGHSADCNALIPLLRSEVYRYLDSKDFSVSTWDMHDLLKISETDYDTLKSQAADWVQEFGMTAEGLIIHTVEMTDTLQGLAIRYGTTAQAIKITNKMGFGGSIYTYKSLLIPATEKPITNNMTIERNPTLEELKAMIRRKMTQKMVTKTGVDFAESLILLELNDFDMQKAMAEHIEMREWEADQHDQNRKKPTTHHKISGEAAVAREVCHTCSRPFSWAARKRTCHSCGVVICRTCTHSVTLSYNGSNADACMKCHGDIQGAYEV